MTAINDQSLKAKTIRLINMLGTRHLHRMIR